MKSLFFSKTDFYKLGCLLLVHVENQRHRHDRNHDLNPILNFVCSKSSHLSFIGKVTSLQKALPDSPTSGQESFFFFFFF